MAGERNDGSCLSAFSDKGCQPTAPELTAMLGRSAEAWATLVADVARDFEPIEAQWNFPAAKFGWSMRLKRKARTVVYLTPCRGSFVVGLVLGARAATLAEQSRLPRALLLALDEAPRYAEGAGIRISVTRKSQLPGIEKLIAAKMS